jgi:hypothetical protein
MYKSQASVLTSNKKTQKMVEMFFEEMKRNKGKE